jgi:hypothetical protein
LLSLAICHKFSFYLQPKGSILISKLLFQWCLFLPVAWSTEWRYHRVNKIETKSEKVLSKSARKNPTTTATKKNLFWRLVLQTISPAMGEMWGLDPLTLVLAGVGDRQRRVVVLDMND